MCGRCRQVFNAFQSLSRVEEPVEPSVASLLEAVAECVPNDDPPEPVLPSATQAEPVDDPIFLRAEPAPMPVAFTAAQSLPPAPLPPEQPSDSFAEVATESAIPVEREAKQVEPSFLQARDAAPVEPAIDLSDTDNPLLAEMPIFREQRPVTPSRAWSVGVFVLFVGLVAQTAYAFRTTFISNYPQLRPAFGALCEFAGCALPWGRDDTAFEIVTSELIESPGKPGRILLTATLVNKDVGVDHNLSFSLPGLGHPTCLGRSAPSSPPGAEWRC